MKKLYVIGSLKNPAIPDVAIKLRGEGYEVFDEWYAVGPDADDKWQEYEAQRGRHHSEALYGHHAQDVFEFDKKHLDLADGVVLVMPAGKSAHLELGYTIGRGKPGFILFDREPDRFDIMHLFATGIAYSFDVLLFKLNAHFKL